MSDKTAQKPVLITSSQAENIIQLLTDIRGLIAHADGYSFDPETKELTPLVSPEEQAEIREKGSRIMANALMKLTKNTTEL